MAIDRVDWYWDDTEKLYIETHGVTGELTDQQYEEIWQLGGNHIGLFVRWLIERGFEGEDADEVDCEKVRRGEMTGTEYLMANCDGKLWNEDIREEVLPFVAFYYTGDGYLKDYAECCTNDDDKPCFGVISDEADYLKLRQRIDAAYERFLSENHQNT